MYDTSIKIFEEFLKKYDKYNIKSIFVNNDSKDLLAFAKNGYNKKYYEETLLSIIEEENLSEYKDVKFCFAEFFENLDIQEYIKNKKIIKYILLLSQCVIVVEIMIRYKKGMEGTIGLNEVYDNFLQKGKNDFYIFRGQSDYEWRLLPSMFRELKESVEINKKYMLDKYFKKGYVLHHQYGRHGANIKYYYPVTVEEHKLIHQQLGYGRGQGGFWQYREWINWWNTISKLF